MLNGHREGLGPGPKHAQPLKVESEKAALALNQRELSLEGPQPPKSASGNETKVGRCNAFCASGSQVFANNNRYSRKHSSGEKHYVTGRVSSSLHLRPLNFNLNSGGAWLEGRMHGDGLYVWNAAPSSFEGDPGPARMGRNTRGSSGMATSRGRARSVEPSWTLPFLGL